MNQTNFSEFSDPDFEEGWGKPTRAHQEQFDALAAKARELRDRERAQHRAAVLREAAALGRELSRQGYSAQEIAARLDRMAEEARS